MSTLDRQRRFEAQLLASARGDDSGTSAQTAWTRFERELGAAALLASGTEQHAVGHAGAGVDAAARDGVGVPATMPARVAAWPALLWLGLGIAVGGAVTAVGLRVLSPQPQAMTVSEPLRPAVAAPGGASVPATDPALPSRSTAPASEAVAPAPRDAPGAVVVTRPEARRASPRPPRRAARSGEARAGAGLSVQVARVDQIRGALAAGRTGRVLALVQRFHARHPRSALAPDAEVLALQALASQGADLQLLRRAEAFLAAYPYDPHSSRVRALLADAARRGGEAPAARRAPP